MKRIFKQSILWLLLTGLVAAGSLASPQQAPTEPPGDDNEAEMKKLVERACTSCHGIDMITSAQKTKDEWKDVTNNMISYGAEVKEAQVPALVEYLARHYGPKK